MICDGLYHVFILHSFDSVQGRSAVKKVPIVKVIAQAIQDLCTKLMFIRCSIFTYTSDWVYRIVMIKCCEIKGFYGQSIFWSTEAWRLLLLSLHNIVPHMHHNVMSLSPLSPLQRCIPAYHNTRWTVSMTP